MIFLQVPIELGFPSRFFRSSLDGVCWWGWGACCNHFTSTSTRVTLVLKSISQAKLSTCDTVSILVLKITLIPCFFLAHILLMLYAENINQDISHTAIQLGPTACLPNITNTSNINLGFRYTRLGSSLENEPSMPDAPAS